MATPTDLNQDAPADRETLVARLEQLMDDAVAPTERSAAEADLAGTAEGRWLLDAWRSLSSPPPAPPPPDMVASVMRQLPERLTHGPVQAPRSRPDDLVGTLGRILSHPRFRYALAFAGLLAIALLMVTGLPALAPGEASGAALGGSDRAWAVVAATAGVAATVIFLLWRRRS